jgi:type I restriction enzyme, S subunit
MITELRPYPAMKGSGVPWLGEVPEHWEVRRLKNVARLIMAQSPSSDDCSTDRIGLPFLQGCAEFGPDQPRPKQFCRLPAKVSPAGAILISVRAPVGRLNIADQEYGIGKGLCALVPKPRLLDTAFSRYALAASSEGLAMVSTGSTYDAVSVDDVGSQPSLLPPFPEQVAIARFLDHADRRIRRYIRAKQKLIRLLEEQKQAIIHRAVTRGLDPNVGLKPSGVEWLGDVPEHWEVLRLGRVIELITGSVSPARVRMRFQR